MSDLSAIARGREALATIADAIVEAGVGRGLRVAVDCPISELALVGHLTRALHARGRACRCLPETPLDPSSPPPDREADSSAVVVITSGFTETGRGVLRVAISVIGGIPAVRGGDVGEEERSRAPLAARPGSDIILDCRDPDGPMIRYMAPHLSRVASGPHGS